VIRTSNLAIGVDHLSFQAWQVPDDDTGFSPGNK